MTGRELQELLKALPAWRADPARREFAFIIDALLSDIDKAWRVARRTRDLARLLSDRLAAVTVKYEQLLEDAEEEPE
jgi:hypothetical protein